MFLLTYFSWKDTCSLYFIKGHLFLLNLIGLIDSSIIFILKKDSVRTNGFTPYANYCFLFPLNFYKGFYYYSLFLLFILKLNYIFSALDIRFLPFSDENKLCEDSHRAVPFSSYRRRRSFINKGIVSYALSIFHINYAPCNKMKM